MYLNEAQMKVVYSNEPKIVVVAPPGSGKTRCMCAAIQEYMVAHPYHTITAITFTKKAANELSERIGSSKVKTGTIHAWALQQLYQLGLKYNFTVDLLEEEEMRRIMQKIAYRKNLKFINIYQLYNYIVGNIKTLDLDDAIIKKYEKIKLEYIAYKHDRGLYDFTDLPQYLLDVLNEYDEEIYDIDAFYVDEFQDIDEIQFEIFEKVCASKKFFIGDFRQAIYGFNGSLEDIFERLAAANFKTFNLNTNYRSKQNIINVADSFREECEQDKYITSLTTIHPSPIVCDRGAGGKVYFFKEDGQCTTTEDEEEQASIIIKNMLNAPDTMVLCRSNKQVRKLQALGINNCSTIHQAKGLEYANVILCDFTITSQEELNVAYVGMTRAKNELCVIHYDKLIEALTQIDLSKTNTSTIKTILF